MSSMGGSSGDSLLSLLALVKDPATYEKRIQELRDREKAAVEADAKLSASKSNIQSDRQSLKEDQAAHDATVAGFLAEKTRIIETAKSFADRKASLDAREHTVKVREGELDTLKKQHNLEVDHRNAALKKREDDVSVKEAKLAAWGIDLAAKEKSLADKLDKLRELAG
jgi:uncharacterized protein (DUF3084 family)